MIFSQKQPMSDSQREYKLFRILQDLFKNRNVAILCGAGISRNSGIPTVKHINSQLVKELTIRKNDSEAIKEVLEKLPFEAVIECILEIFPNAPVFEIYKRGTPGGLHAFIAESVVKNCVTSVVTTNFDTLIEDAFPKEGIRRLKVLSSEKEFGRVGQHDHELVKIHGTIDNLDSIRTTIKSITQKKMAERSSGVIKILFASGSAKAILILGYSCSDHFDITPTVRKVAYLAQDLKSQIFIICHVEGINNFSLISIDESENAEGIISKIKKASPFTNDEIAKVSNFIQGFNATVILADTSKFLGQLSDNLWGKNVVKNVTHDTQAKLPQSSVIGYIPNGYADLIASSLFLMVSDFERTCQFLKRAQSTALQTGDKQLQISCLINLGIAQSNLGELSRAITNIQAAIRLNKARSKSIDIRCQMTLGAVYFHRGDFDCALQYFNSALKLCKKYGDRTETANCYVNIGCLLTVKRKYKEAIKHHEKARETALAEGDKTLEIRCLINLGNAHLNNGNFKSALKYFGESIEISEKLGDQQNLAKSRSATADVRLELREYSEAIKHYKASLKASSSIKDPGLQSHAHFGLGDAYSYGKPDLWKSVYHYIAAGDLMVTLGNKMNASTCFTRVGKILCFQLCQPEKGIDYYLKALRLSKDIHDQHGEYECCSKLDLAYRKIDDISNSEKYYMRTSEMRNQGFKPYDSHD